MQWPLDHIVSATGGRLAFGPAHGEFAGIGIDSRTIAHDHLFVAIPGDRFNGHNFIPQVLAKGVTGVLIEAAALDMVDQEALKRAGATCVVVDDTIRALGLLAHHQRRSATIPVVAITGSNGKTTTRQLAAAVTGVHFNTLSTQGNLNNEIGLPLTLFRLEADHQAAVLELGMNHRGEIDRLGAICSPTIGVITNVGPAHLEFLGSLEQVALAKAELIDHVDPQGTLILNADDPYVAAMAQKAGSRRVIFYGTQGRSQVRATRIRDTAWGQRFDLVWEDTMTEIKLYARGSFMVSNALAAAGAGLAMELPVEDVKTGLESFRQGRGRMAIISTEDGINIIDDTYNANPTSMKAAIETLAILKGTDPGIVMVGDMHELGPQAEDFHRQVGQQAADAGIERLYACGEHAEAVARGARQAGFAADRIITGTRDDIAREARQHTKPGAWVLIKGSRAAAMEHVVDTLMNTSDGTKEIKGTV